MRNAYSSLTPEMLRDKINSLGEWFHNIELQGIKTAPNHFLGDYPRVKWQNFSKSIPEDLSGKSVLDIGCNGGFYSIEMKRRGADLVVGIDPDEKYLEQARFAAEISGVELELINMSVYEISALRQKFDLVLFMGVLYHLRHPLLALDMIRQHVIKDMFIFQSMIRGSENIVALQEDYPFSETAIFEKEGFPAMFFIENKYSGDPTNWWIPNRSCAEAMVRSAGFEIISNPEPEVFVCRKADIVIDPLENPTCVEGRAI